VIPAKAVIGYVNGIRDMWVEYSVYNKTFISSTGREKTMEGMQSYTMFVEKNKQNQFKAKYEFTNEYFRKV